MIAAADQNRGAPASEPGHPPIAVVDIGNSCTSVGLWSGTTVSHRQSCRGDDPSQVRVALRVLAKETEAGFLQDVAVASVVPSRLVSLSAWIEDELNLEPLVIGRQVPLPMEVALPDPGAVGVDRVCCAAAAYARKREACVVVDFGTAITVDVVDDAGAFMGGAILPGMRLQTRSLHEHTAVLPEVAPVEPKHLIGRNTAEAIRVGVLYGTAGAVRGVVEAFATQLGRWPPAVATGGDAARVAAECDIFDAIVPELCLQGVGLAYSRRLDRAVPL